MDRVTTIRHQNQRSARESRVPSAASAVRCRGRDARPRKTPRPGRAGRVAYRYGPVRHLGVPRAAVHRPGATRVRATLRRCAAFEDRHFRVGPQSPVAYRCVVPGSGGPLLDTVGTGGPAIRRRHRVCRHEVGVGTCSHRRCRSRSRGCMCIIRSPSPASRSASSSRPRNSTTSRERSIRSCASTHAPAGVRSISPLTQRASSRCRRLKAGCCCAT